MAMLATAARAGGAAWGVADCDSGMEIVAARPTPRRERPGRWRGREGFPTVLSAGRGVLDNPCECDPGCRISGTGLCESAPRIRNPRPGPLPAHGWPVQKTCEVEKSGAV